MLNESLADLPEGSRILVDANIFIYAADRLSRECTSFLDDCVNQKLYAFTTLEVMTEVVHRLMLEDAVTSGFVSRPRASVLRNRRDVVQQLRGYWRAVSDLMTSNIGLLPTDEA